MTAIAPCLWFDGQAEQAATYYVSLFPNSRIDHVWRAPVDFPSGKKGDVLMVEFTLDGRPFQGLNGGPPFKFTQAISMSAATADQAETDRLWEALIADGGKPVQCGWLEDRWGLSWQIVPTALSEMMRSPDRAAAGRAMEAMMHMIKLDIATLERAFKGRVGTPEVSSPE